MTDGPYSLLAELSKVRGRGKPPIHLWHPENVNDIDMEIRANGQWFYQGTPIKRQRLVQLFATVMRREGEQYYLVTPVEKCLVRVEDVPFQAILMSVAGQGQKQVLSFTTNMADEVDADSNHLLRFESLTGEPRVYLSVRDGLEARLNRNVYYQLADLLTDEIVSGQNWLGVWSRGTFFPVIESAVLEEY